MTDKKYINGIFISAFKTQYGEAISIGITDEGIEQLKSLPKNEKGVRNFAAFRQKNDNKKFSALWPKESSFKGQENDRGDEAPPHDDKDEMPF